MEKNSFLIFNDILYELYASPTREALSERFLPRLKLLIPFSYASILTIQSRDAQGLPRLTQPICFPAYFCEAEEKYLEFADEDHLLWLLHRQESTLVRESDLLNEQERRSTPLYLHCYQKYDIFDTLQYSIVFCGETLGVLTLFRTRIDGVFSDEDLFFLRSLGTHLNLAMHRFSQPCAAPFAEGDMTKAAAEFHLTVREAQLLPLLLTLHNTDEIAAEMQIRENTIQKHMQNLFRKLNVSSRWELLRLFQNPSR